jgi:hypothetical protein
MPPLSLSRVSRSKPMTNAIFGSPHGAAGTAQHALESDAD